MVETREILALMVREGISREQMAETMQISLSTLSRKLKSGNFNIKEAQVLIDTLKIKNPARIFFK